MCGIYGIWQRDGATIEVDALLRATTSISHRGPDDEGYALFNSADAIAQASRGPDTVHALRYPPLHDLRGEVFDLAFGFRRLSILDLSPAGHQPMSSADSRLWMVFNGEIYNYRELRAELVEHGHSFRSGADSEVILASYSQWGTGCFKRFNGMWALALWDSESRSLLLSRDRFGVKPLYFTDMQGTFAFASEIKALVGSHGIPFVPNEEEIYRYLVYGTLPSPTGGQTFFEGVQSLLPAHWMRVSQNGVVTEQYWNLPSAESAAALNATEAVAEFGRLFEDSVRLRLASDVPVGTCLSGGLDSSSIVTTIGGLMAVHEEATVQVGDRQKTFSAVYGSNERYDEKPFVDIVLQVTNAEGNFTVPSYARMDCDLERLVWHQDQPFQSTSIFAQWCVMSLVRERGVTVLLDGQGADELLAGYRPFNAFLSDVIQRRQFGRAFAEARAAEDCTGLSAMRLLVGGAAYCLVNLTRPHVPASWLQKLRSMRSRPRIPRSVLAGEFASRHRGVLPPPVPNMGDGFLDSILREAITETSLPHLLHYEDRNSMAFGVEARVPFLDYRLVEYMFSQGFPFRIRHGWTKWILRQAMTDLLPSAIAWRRDKVGFETPETTWTRQWLDAHPAFFQPGTIIARYLDVESLNQEISSWMQHGGDVRAVRRIWRWINLAVWLELWHGVCLPEGREANRITVAPPSI